jgi:hypothetical protein
VCGAVRRPDDAGGVGEENAVCAGEYFGTAATFAETGERRVRREKKKERVGRGAASGSA